MAKRPGMIAIPDVLGRFLKSHGVESRMLEFSLKQHWLEIVGEHIARHTWPDSIRHRKLYLVAENSVWLQQLRFLKPELLAKLSSRAGNDGITDIVLRVGTLPPPEVEESPGDAEVQQAPSRENVMPADVRASIETVVQAITDPDLQTRLRTLFQKAASS